jgi:O-antigen/teichoic acid export membrane protein
VTTVIEAVACRVLLMRVMPKSAPGQNAHWRLLTNELRFAGGLALSSAVGTMIYQADKLTLSHVLPLAEFGVFSLVVSVCSGIALVVPPFAQAFQPRLTTLLAQGRRAEFVLVYRLSLVLIAVLVLGMAGAIAAQPEMVLFAWTGHRDLAVQLAPVLALYAAGTGISAFLFAPFFLQFAHGVIRLHVIGNILFGVVWIPAIVWSAVTYGTLGAGAAWLTGNLLFLIFWTPVVHRRFLSKAERRGMGPEVWLRVLVIGGALAATRVLHPAAFNRLESLAALAAISITLTLAGVLSSRALRRAIMDFLPRGLRLG